MRLKSGRIVARDEVVLPDGTREAYRIRYHGGARRIVLRVTDRALVVTAPPHVRSVEIRAAVDRRREWIATALAEARALAPEPLMFGDRIPLLGGSVVITEASGRGARRLGDRLLVPVGTSIGTSVHAWYRRTARTHFGRMMDGWAPRIGVAPSRLAVRDQRSRWGSASATGAISINWRLVMAPHEVGEYVMVHELVHLHHMDHSPAFWTCLETHWPAHRRERAWLRRHGPRLMTGPQAFDLER
jgi:predicted metal-dependent hydrolase